MTDLDGNLQLLTLIIAIPFNSFCRFDLFLCNDDGIIAEVTFLLVLYGINEFVRQP